MSCRLTAALIGAALLAACGGSGDDTDHKPTTKCSGENADCKVTAEELQKRDELRAEQEQQRRGDRRGRERDLMTRKDSK